MIKIEGLSKKYGDQPALKSIDLDLSIGQSIALVGPNGSGKTTLLKIILGHVRQTNGTVKVNGSDTSKGFNYRKNIGYMPQINQYPPNMTVGHLFEMIKSLREDSATDTELFDRYELNRIWKKRMGTLSGGMTQQVSAAMAFLFDPDILILDEPTAALDPESNEILKEKVKKSTGNKLFINTSHILNDLDDMTNKVVYLMHGEVIFHESMDELRKETSEEKLNKILLKKIKTYQS